MGYIVCLGCYLTQLRVFSDALWIRCTVCIEYSPIYLNYLKPWTCVYLRYTSGTALRDTRTVGRYIFKRLCVAYHLRHLFCDSYLRHLFVTCICVIYCTTWWTYTYSTNCSTELDDWNIPACYVDDGFDDFLVDWYAHVIYAGVFTRRIWIWHFFVAIVYLYTSVHRGVEQWYFGCHIMVDDMVRVYTVRDLSIAALADMIFNVVIHL